MSARQKLGVVLLLITAGAAIYYFVSTDRSKDLVLIGTVDANQVIVNSQISGRIQKLLVDEGTAVKAGDVVALLDPTELEAAQRAAAATLNSLRSQVQQTQATELMTKGSTASDVANAQARLRAAQSQYAAAQADLERIQLDTQRTVALANQGIASAQDRDRAVMTLRAQQANVKALDDQVRAADADLNAALARTHNARAAQSTVAATQAQMINAQAALAEATTRLGYTRILAPVSGVVSVRAAREGEVVNPASPIVTIIDFNDTWVRAPLPETYADSVRLGDSFPVRLPSGRMLTGKLIFKAAEDDFATQRDVSRRKRDIKTFVLKLAVPNPDRALAPGLTAEVLIPHDLVERVDQQARAAGVSK
jgi:multidrug resistance efflux pump